MTEVEKTNVALQAREMETAINTPEMIAEHERITQGMIRTRFPPEPNGYLHIGHAKSMNMNFEGAFEKLGVPVEKRLTFLRYDDTNPEAESQEYIQAIRDNVEWLGWKPFRITHSSEYFDELYELAIKLINKGLAYVCYQSKDEMEKGRNLLREFHKNPENSKNDAIAPGASPCRNRSIEENLIEFEKMKKGFYSEGEVCLRMKMDLKSPNPNMWDSVAYRIKYCPHPHIGDKWCIYPTYDYTHCVVDALEHIDYSICTLEFETRRESYYWLLHALDLYKPKVYEFARLNLTNTALSKRKLKALVDEKKVCGWNDPRLPTLAGLKRRGYSPAILNGLCKEIGVTRVNSTVEMKRLQAVARQELGKTSRRAMAILEPLHVRITNFEENIEEFGNERDVPDFPVDSSTSEPVSTHKIILTPSVYIDRKDFREDGINDSAFYGLAPGKEVGLKHCYNITCTNVKKDKNGEITELEVTMDRKKLNKPKGHLTWVPSLPNGKKPTSSTIRVYGHLLIESENEKSEDGKPIMIVNPESEKVYKNALVDASVSKATVGTAVQFERLGYYVVDPNSTSKCQVWNETVALRESVPTSTQNTSRKAAQEQQLAAKAARSRIPPTELFKQQKNDDGTPMYSEFDQDGIPTKDGKGEKISKSAIKKLKKEWTKQKALYEKTMSGN